MTKRYEEQGHAHFLTFGCYRRKHLFTDPPLASLFISHLQRVRIVHHLNLFAHVVMPNHVHLLLRPPREKPLSSIMIGLKRPFSSEAIEYLKAHKPDVMNSLRSRTGIRFWQHGGGYDRKVYSDDALRKTIEYIHNNPVRAGLVGNPEEWRWSSAGYWVLGEKGSVELDDPFTIT